MGYSPNSSARSLKTNRSRNIGVLFMDQSQSGLTHEFFAQVLDSFKRGIESKGYDMTFILNHSDDYSGMSYLEHSRFRGFDGIIIACVDFSNPEVCELMRSSIPVVTIDYIFNGTSTILSDNVNGMKSLVQYAVDMGHRKIAYIYGEQSLVTSGRINGYYITLEENGIEPREEYVRQAHFRNIADAERITEELLALPEPPTCILYPDDVACIGGINYLRDKGYKVPEDISVAGYDGITFASRISPHLTTIVQDTKKIGALAAEKLINLIEKPKTTLMEQIMVATTLCEGQTIAQRK